MSRNGILDAGRFELLRSRIDALVAAEPGLAPTARAVLAPCLLLEAMGRDVPPALGDDRGAAERLKLTVALAGEVGIHRATVRALLDEVGEGTAPEAICPLASPGLVSRGWFALAALAAARIASTGERGRALVNNVLGAALATGPAEHLARALVEGATDEQIRALLTGLAAINSRPSPLSPGPFTSSDSGETVAASRPAAALTLFLAEPTEQARWRSFVALADRVLELGPGQPWDATIADGIEFVRPAEGEESRPACAGEKIAIGFSAQHPALERLRGSDVFVVFDATSGGVVAERAEVQRKERRLLAEVPKDAASGWLGYTDEGLLDQCNDFRARIVAVWEELNATLACLRDDPVPTDLVTALVPPSPPPRRAGTRLRGGLPAILFAKLEPVEAASPSAHAPASALRLVWSTLGAQRVWLLPDAVEVSLSGERLIDPRTRADSVPLVLVAENDCGQTSRELDAEVPESGASIRVVLLRPATIAPERRRGEERGAGGIGHRFRRVSLAEARRMIERSFAALGVPSDVIEPPWVPDADLVVAPSGDGYSPAAVEKLLERLSLLAAETPGGEEALWLALLPEAKAQAESRVAPADAALGVAAATPRGLQAAAADAIVLSRKATRGPALPRLRLTGRLRDAGTLELSSRLDHARATGAGAPESSRLRAVALDASGLELARVPVRRVRKVDHFAFAALLAPSEETAAVELRLAIDRQRERRVGVVHLSRDEPEVSKVALDADRFAVSWCYHHPWSARPEQFVELVRDGLSSIVARPGPCDRKAELPAHRLGPGTSGDRIRVVATDGWSASVEDVPASSQVETESSDDVAIAATVPLLPHYRIVARDAARGRYWADVLPETARFRWRLLSPDGVEVFTSDESAVELPAGFSGTLVLEFRDEAARDEVAIGRTEVSHVVR